MGDKKHSGRFSLYLKSENPQHRRVIEILESKGRHKTQFIVEAILRHEDEIKVTLDLNHDLLKNMVAELVRDYLKDVPLPEQPTAKSTSLSSGSEAVDDDLLAAVQNSMATFRNE